MSATINQCGLYTIEYTLRKKRLEDPLYVAAHPECLVEPSRQKYAHNTPYDSCTASSPLTRPPIDIFYADQLAGNMWAKPMAESPSMYSQRQGEWFAHPRLQNTLEVNSPYLPCGGHAATKMQTKWEQTTAEPPQITKQKRERFPVVLSSMSKYVEEMNAMENGFKLY